MIHNKYLEKVFIYKLFLKFEKRSLQITQFLRI